ncbi:hypothetical protein Vadar_020070 [Vaccinium darrowii]|uniref:Uncharacterized protein n=1 Tax=Vaccinium darrowii TaxID=229202 RepID=A0ACB7Y0A2_9ERIC|nr:hypothetical protein Vadar_020070 [Vaccinium darrowii]
MASDDSSLIITLLSLSTAIVFFIRSSSSNSSLENKISVSNQVVANPFDFMKSKLVLLVSHELSLSGKRYDFICIQAINPTRMSVSSVLYELLPQDLDNYIIAILDRRKL